VDLNGSDLPVIKQSYFFNLRHFKYISGFLQIDMDLFFNTPASFEKTLLTNFEEESFPATDHLPSSRKNRALFL